jgi:hypothetical protein
MDETYDPAWSLTGGGANLEKRRDTFNRLARRAIVALGQKFTNPDEAVDAWLNRLHKFHWGRKTKYGRNHWCVSHVSDASAEYCAELSTRFHEDGNVDSEGKLADLERKFRGLSDTGAEISAIRRRDSGLRRDRYPFDHWLHDHPHEPLPDPKMELDYWVAHVWRGYQTQIENGERLDRTGPAWAALREKLKDSTAGLNYDLAVLQANYAIDRGLRGDEAMLAFQDEAAKLFEQVIDAWRRGSSRLTLSFDDGAEDIKTLAEAVDRVRNDLRKLLQGLPPAAVVPFIDLTQTIGLTGKPSDFAAGGNLPVFEMSAIGPVGLGSGFQPGLPDLDKQLQFSTQSLPDGPEDLRQEVADLAHTTITALTRNSSVPRAAPGDWLEELRKKGYAFETMEELLVASAKYLDALVRDALAVGPFEDAERLTTIEKRFSELRARFFGSPITQTADADEPPPARPQFPQATPTAMAEPKNVREWGDLTMTFISDERVTIAFFGAPAEHRNYEEMGFGDGRGGRPRAAWLALRELSGAPTTPLRIDKKRAQEIRALLKRQFLVNSDPLLFKKQLGYVTRFKICRGGSFDM